MSDLTEALERAFPVYAMGGLSGAIYPLNDGDDPTTDAFVPAGSGDTR